MKAMNAMKSWFKSSVALVAVVFGFAANAELTKGGDGKYHIASAADLATLASDVNGGNTFEGETIQLDANIDLSAYDKWTPIGADATPFKGTFDGQNKAITGASIKGDDAGLFGCIKTGAYVKNFSIAGTGVPEGANAAIGGVVGRFDGGTIDGVVNYVNISASETYARQGGIVGIVKKTPSTIKNCKNYGTISRTYNYTSAAGCLGGIVGQPQPNGLVIEDCVNYGAISGQNCYGVGGIVGEMKSNAGDFTPSAIRFTRCVNYGALTLNHVGSIGGIVGRYVTGKYAGSYQDMLYGEFEDCANYGTLSGNYESGEEHHIGNLLGASTWGGQYNDVVRGLIIGLKGIAMIGNVDAMQHIGFKDVTATRAGTETVGSTPVETTAWCYNAVKGVTTAASGDVVTLQADCEDDFVIPAGVSVDTNSKTCSGTVTAAPGCQLVFENGIYRAIVPVAKIGDKTYTDLATALSEVQPGQTIEIIKSGAYEFASISGSFTIDGSNAGGEVSLVHSTHSGGNECWVMSSVALKGVTLDIAKHSGSPHGYEFLVGVTSVNCAFKGDFILIGGNSFTGCTFYAPGTTESGLSGVDYSAWCYYGSAAFTNCHFYCAGKALHAYSEGNEGGPVIVKGCDFHSTAKNKAALNIKETGNGNALHYTVSVEDCTTDDNFPAGTAFDASKTLWVVSPLAQIDDRNTTSGFKTGIKLAIDGTQVYPELNFYQDAQNPNLWHIANLAGLKEFRASCINEVNYEKKTVRLDADIDLGNEEWTPIPATYAQDDTAIFDGNGKTISNLKVTASGKSAGLFAQAIGWTIKDLAIDGASVSGIGWCGAIVGYGSCVCVDGCTVKNASVTSNVANNDDGDKAGAIVGYLSAENTAWIKNCAVSNCTIKGYRDIGGVTGYANGESEVSGCTVKDTTVINDKSVNYKGYTTDDQYNVHEVVGNKDADATVKDNTVTNVEVVQPKMVAKIGFKEYETLQAALAAAQKNDTVELLADIDLEGAAWTPVAFGYKTFDGKGHKISNFTATGEKNVGFFGTATCSMIKNLTVENATVSGINHVAAIAGDGLCAKIENCTAKNCSVTTSVKSNDDGDKAAGICGYLSGEPNAWVKNCLVTGCTITGYRDCGGAVGYANGGAVVSGTTVKDTTIVNDRSNNYKNYTKNAEFDIHEIVGEVTPTASVTGNTADNVKILGMVYAVQIGDKGYEALEDAVGAVQNGETILLLANNAEVFTAGTTALFVIDPTNFTFTASNVTPLDGCELVGNLDGTYTYRMKVVVKDQITKNVVETKVEDEVVAAAVAITDDNFGTIFKETGSKELEVVASGVGTVSFNSAAVDQIGANMKEVIAAVGGEEETATTKTTLTVAIADVTEEVKEEKPEIIITEQGNLEVVQAISVTAIMRTIVQQAGSSETVSTNDEVFAQGKTIAACVSTVTIPYSGIAPQVWYVDTTVAPWTTNAMDTAYNADTKELSFAVAHFSDYVITDAETYAMVGAEKFRTLQEAFDWVEADQTQGTTITLTKTNTLTSAATFDGALATLNLNGKAVVGSIAAGAGSILTVTNGTIDAGSAVFASGAATAKIYLVGGTYLGQFPDPSGLATNAGPLLISGGKFEHEIPWAYCAPGYEPNPTPVGGFYTVKNAKIYIRDISACQRYPWNGYVDITLDVCWDGEVKAKLYASAWDLAGATPAPISMKNATLLEEGVSGSRSVNCEKGFEVTAPEKKTLHLIWNSADEGVPTGTKRERVGFKFMSKRVNAN